MDKKSKYLVVFFFAAFIVAAVAKYDALVTRRDFVIYDYVSCDPAESSCFDYCEDGECDGEPYAKIEKHASRVSFCKTYETDTCEELSCDEGEDGCAITYCSEENLEEGEICFVDEEDAEAEEESDETEEADQEDEEAPADEEVSDEEV